jgi:K+-transporting ATPase ATPase C chain
MKENRMRLKELTNSIVFLLAMTVVLGFVYPAAVTLVAGLAFPDQAAGSPLIVDGKLRGSRLLAQDFTQGGFFLARPSAAGWATVPGGASNLAASNPARRKEAEAATAAWVRASARIDVQDVAQANAQASGDAGAPPEDMLRSSGSGLDPDISLESALGQIDRVAAERGLGAEAKAALEREIRALAAASTTILGPPRVNVVVLNAFLAAER